MAGEAGSRRSPSSPSSGSSASEPADGDPAHGAVAHRCGFNPAALAATLAAAGFAQVLVLHRPEHFDLRALASLGTWPDRALIAAALAPLPLSPEA